MLLAVHTGRQDIVELARSTPARLARAGHKAVMVLGGSTGIITTVKLKVVEATPERPILLAVKAEDAAIAAHMSAARKRRAKPATWSI